MSQYRPLFVLCVALLSMLGRSAAFSSSDEQSTKTEVKTPAEWFKRASDQMSLRLPGAAPFHLKVVFHAFPGEELLDSKEAPQMVTGDGTYEETWIAPHQWRREITLGSYRAVEVESDKGHKMQASSEYVPSRVLMLLGALLYPIPHEVVSGEARSRSDSPWSIAHLTKGDISLVRIANSHTYGEQFTVHSGYYFLPGGLLVLKNENGLTISWQDDALFSGKVVPKVLTVKADGLKANAPDRDLLTASLSIDAHVVSDTTRFDLDGPPTDPSMTLRPLKGFASPPRPKDDAPHWQGDHNAAFVLWGVIDRTGTYRELEVTSAVDATNLRQFMEDLRRSRFRPAEIDGAPCELPWPIVVMRENRVDMR